jgi:hypothetical protein
VADSTFPPRASGMTVNHPPVLPSFARMTVQSCEHQIELILMAFVFFGYYYYYYYFFFILLRVREFGFIVTQTHE